MARPVVVEGESNLNALESGVRNPAESIWTRVSRENQSGAPPASSVEAIRAMLPAAAAALNVADNGSSDDLIIIYNKTAAEAHKYDDVALKHIAELKGKQKNGNLLSKQESYELQANKLFPEDAYAAFLEARKLNGETLTKRESLELKEAFDFDKNYYARHLEDVEAQGSITVSERMLLDSYRAQKIKGPSRQGSDAPVIPA